MVVLYQKMAERVFYDVGVLKYKELLIVLYFLSFPIKIVFFLKNVVLQATNRYSGERSPK